MKNSLDKAFEEHTKMDAVFQDRVNRVLFGDTDEKGMKDKVDDMHAILVQAQNIGGFFTGIKGVLGWLLILGAFIVLAKGWLTGIVGFFISKI